MGAADVAEGGSGADLSLDRGPGPGHARGDDAAGRERPASSHRLTKAGAAGAALLGYAALAAALFWKPVTSGGSLFVTWPGDAQLAMWWLRWVPFDLLHHHDPLLTDYVRFPHTVNAMWNTSVVFPALVAAPLTAAANVQLSYDILTAASFALAAFFAYLAAARFVASRWAAAAAGLVYGFSPFMLFQLGHFHLTTAAPLVPLLLLGAEDLVRGHRLPAWLAGGAIGALASALLLSAEEVLATGALVGMLVLLWAAVLAAARRDDIDWRRGLTGAACALAVFVVLAAWPVYVQFRGPGRVSGPLQTPDTFVSDLLAFFVPPYGLHFTTVRAESIAGAFTGNGSENNAYIGIPFLLLAALALALRRDRLAWWAAGGLVGCAVLSLGPHLHVGGSNTHFRLPWAVIQKLPLYASALPSRVMQFGFLFLGLLVALLLERAFARGRLVASLSAAATALALVAWLPNLPTPATADGTPPFFTSAAIARVPAGAVVLVTPVDGSVAQEWQAAAGMRFRILTGVTNAPAAPTALEVTLSRVELTGRAPAVTPALRALLRADLKANHVFAVFSGPTAGSGAYMGSAQQIPDGDARSAETSFLTELLGAPSQPDGGVDVWWLGAT